MRGSCRRPNRRTACKPPSRRPSRPRRRASRAPSSLACRGTAISTWRRTMLTWPESLRTTSIPRSRSKRLSKTCLRSRGEKGARPIMMEQLTYSRRASLKDVDPEIYEAIELEKGRQNNKIELIASENFVSEAVLEAPGSVLTNKYAEGLPDRRYYGGCEYVDIAEKLAIQRAKELFGADHANVQPHSGAQANQAVFYAALNPGDTVMGMSLPHGGHLTHGSPVNFSGKWFKVVSYEVDPVTERIDYDALRALAKEHRPKLIIAGASAYPRIIDFQAFREICDEVGALLMVDMAH